MINCYCIKAPPENTKLDSHCTGKKVLDSIEETMGKSFIKLPV